jgi:hypothetical protein
MYFNMVASVSTATALLFFVIFISLMFYKGMLVL